MFEARVEVLGVLFPGLTEDESPLFDGTNVPWEVVDRLPNQLAEPLPPGTVVGVGVRLFGATIDCRQITIGDGAVIEPGAVIFEGPVLIGPGVHVRSGAYFRGAAYVGRGAVVGHATEVKNSILLADAKAPHFNYVGDSIFDRDVNLGAGTILSFSRTSV